MHQLNPLSALLITFSKIILKFFNKTKILIKHELFAFFMIIVNALNVIQKQQTQL